MTTLQAAKSLHCILSGFKVSIGEEAYPEWEEISERRQKFFIDAVPYVLEITKFESDHEKRCEYVHEYWIEWSVMYDSSHMSLVGYDKLSDTEKIKDGLVVNAILAFADYIDDK